MKYLSLIFTLSFGMLMSGCSSKGTDPMPTTTPTPTPAVTVSELIKKSWSVNTASWDGVNQYTKGATSNAIPGYSQYKLDLSSGSSVTLTEFDGKKFTGSYLLSSDNKKITLSALTSAEGAPSGTNGTLELTITATPSATSLVLETTTNYIKATNKKVSVSLINP